MEVNKQSNDDATKKAILMNLNPKKKKLTRTVSGQKPRLKAVAAAGKTRFLLIFSSNSIRN